MMAGDDSHEKWYTVSEAIGAVGKSERTVRRWIANNDIPSRRIGHRLQVRIPWLEETPASEPGNEPDEQDETPELKVLLAKLESQQALIEQVAGERDYLRQLLAAAMSNQKLIESQPKKRGFFARLFGGDD